MGMKAGDLNRRLTILRGGTEDDGFQTVSGAFDVVGTVWASRSDISDGERGRAGGIEATATTRFQVRYSAMTAAVTPKDRVKEGTQTFNVLGVKEIGRRIGFEITASRRSDV